MSGMMQRMMIIELMNSLFKVIDIEPGDVPLRRSEIPSSYAGPVPG